MADEADTQMLVEDHIPKSEIIVEARAAAVELGASPVSPGTGATLRMLVVIAGTRTVLEVGIDTGVSDLWLLDGMLADGALTSVDSEAEFHQQARRVFTAVGVLTQHTRLIAGHAPDALLRMTAHGYDMIVLDAGTAEAPEHLGYAARTSRLGKVIVFVYALWHNQAANPVRRDRETVVCHRAVRFFTDSPDFTPTILPVGDGLAMTAKC